jgi:hypothetical protein
VTPKFTRKLPMSDNLAGIKAELARLTEIVTELRQTNTKLDAENTTLRGVIAAKPDAPCVYCGLEDMSRCRRGFPGCAKADDMICAEEQFVDRFRITRAVAEAAMNLEKFLGENTGGHVEFPVQIVVSDDESAATLTTLLKELHVRVEKYKEIEQAAA